MNALAAMMVALAVGEVTSPPKLEVPVGRLAKIEVVSSGKITVVIPPGGDAEVVQEVTTSGKLSYRIICYRAGVYRVVFVTSTGDLPEFSVTEVTAKDTLPPPPKPPLPPEDELKATLGALYGADQNPDKDKVRVALVDALRKSSAVAVDPATVLASDLVAGIKKLSSGLPAGALPAIRDKVGELLNAVLPSNLSQKLSAEDRKAAETVLTKIADALEGIR